MLSARCFCNMSFVREKLENEGHPIVQNLKRTVIDLYEAVKSKFSTACESLTVKENKISSIVNDGFSKIFKRESMKTKDTFLGGIENSDFSKDEQIAFTFEEYIKPLLGQMDEKTVEGNREVVRRLEQYVNINSIRLKELKDTKFAERVDKLINGGR